MTPNDSNRNRLLSDSPDGTVSNVASNSTNHTIDTALTSAFWKNDWSNVQKSLSSLRSSLASFPSSPLRIMRVSQLDADLLDFELFDMLKEQLWLSFSLFNPQFKQTFEPELLAILQLIMYRLSIYESGASYGAQLQNLKYRNERQHWGGLQSTAKDSPLTKFQKFVYGALTIGGQYMWMRVNRLVTAQGWGELSEDNPRKVFWKILQKVENVYKSLSLLNFLIFLYDGKYRTLIDRILSMRLVYTRRIMNRQVSFEFLNRQLVWHAFTEFLLFLMPLINLRKLKNILKRKFLPEAYSKSHTLDFLPMHICAICHENQSASNAPMSSVVTVDSSKIHNPYETNCGHIYCYFCIKTKLIQEDGTWQCLRCGDEVKEIKRVLEKLVDENDNDQEENDSIRKNKGKHPEK
ncbi:16849_t:CDS:2 [Funneliformis mosseae]|uniref:RING-type E3 ubiquitin transferase (cysteine targeting) n=1 Tax=Funneliformis mosseae TaxID=27381 RepID=A0A9N8W5F8_FUNMO|nr:16849_t:CDS:2 [Funneliformis mosseae]